MKKKEETLKQLEEELTDGTVRAEVVVAMREIVKHATGSARARVEAARILVDLSSEALEAKLAGGRAAKMVLPRVPDGSLELGRTDAQGNLVSVEQVGPLQPKDES